MTVYVVTKIVESQLICVGVFTSFDAAFNYLEDSEPDKIVLAAILNFWESPNRELRITQTEVYEKSPYR